jgi:hypothetical protein
VKDPSLLTDPTRIYNADESGFSLCPSKGSKVVGSKGAPVVYHFGNSDKTQMTIMAAASAAGHFVQPMIIYPGQRFAYNPLEGFEDAAFGRSENGWMDSEVFISWLRNVFIPSIESRNVRKPVLLLIDGHKTHVSMEASDTCLANGVELYCLLEHSSHIMQPLDLRFFATLKFSWRLSVRDWQTENVGESVTKQTFAKVFKQAWVSSATVDAAVKGFLESGLFPLDPSRVTGSVKLESSQVFTSPSMDVPVVNSASKPLSVSDTPPSETTSRTLNEDPDAADAAVESVNSVPLALAATETIYEQVSSPMKMTAEKSSSTSTEAASPFSKFLTIPSLKVSKPNVRRVLMPKAITGLKYR